MAQALDNHTRQWRECRIDKRTPKNRNYPNGGAYIYWTDRKLETFESAGGWQPPQCIRATDEEWNKAPMANY